MRLILASASPRRKELLERLGLAFEVEAPDIDESRLPGEGPGDVVERLARAKATGSSAPGRTVIGADTMVVHRGQIMGKPGHPEEARTMLRSLSGTRHEVFTSVAVSGWVDDSEVVESLVDVAEVTFLPMTDDEIDEYVATGEPMDKAGAYALQGVGGRFIESISGSPYTVIGLPIHLLSRLLERTGHGLGSFKMME